MTSNRRISPGICPTCGTDLDHDEMRWGDGWFEAFCCMCSKYVRKRWQA